MSATSQEFVSFMLADQVLGIAVAQVQEILPQRLSTRVPSAPPAVSGILNLRGQIVTTLDLRRRLGLPPRPGTGAFMSIVVHHEGELFNLQVDSVGDVASVDASGFAVVPPTLDPLWRECCSGVYRLEDGLLIAVSVEKLLSDSNNHSRQGRG